MFAQSNRTTARTANPHHPATITTKQSRHDKLPLTLIGIIFPLAILFGAFLSPIQAQTINCAPAAECSWISRSTTFDLSWYVNPGCAGCQAQVDYRFRSGCNNGNSCEIEILSIKFWGTCSGCTVGDIIKYSVVTAMLYSCGYPEAGQCVENVQVWMAACQKKTHLGDFSFITKDCYNEACCSAKYKLCRLGTGGFVTLTRTDSETLSTQPCSTIDLDLFYPNNSFSGCFMACDAMPDGEIEFESALH